MKNFKKLQIWQKGIEIVKLCYGVTNQLPVSEKYNLIAQINRSAVSIPSNIAEDSSRKSEKDYFRFLEIALGSCFELETQLNIGRAKVFFSEEIATLLDTIKEEQQMISGLARKLNT